MELKMYAVNKKKKKLICYNNKNTLFSLKLDFVKTSIMFKKKYDTILFVKISVTFKIIILYKYKIM